MSSGFVSLTSLLGAQCSHCGKHSVTLCQCPCKKAYYCDVGCQRSHWPIHKETCTKAQRHVGARLHRCASCGSLSNVLKICGCGTVYYCSLECQRKHYGIHRRICTVASSRAAATGGAALSGGNMLSAYGDSSPGIEGTATVACQTDETCERILTEVQRQFAEDAARRKKLLEDNLNERRKSVREGAMSSMGHRKSFIAEHSAANIQPSAQSNNNNNKDSAVNSTRHSAPISPNEKDSAKFPASNAGVTFVEEHKDDGAKPSAAADNSHDADSQNKRLQRKESTGFEAPQEAERSERIAKMNSFRQGDIAMQTDKI